MKRVLNSLQPVALAVFLSLVSSTAQAKEMLLDKLPDGSDFATRNDFLASVNFVADKDWVQLNSGEIIVGKLEELLDAEIFFDSDDLGDLVIDMKDVSRINSHSAKTIHLLNRGTYNGSFVYDNNRVVIGGKMFKLVKEDIVSITRYTNKERERWENDFGFGANIHSGNNNAKEFTGKFSSVRTEANSRLRMNYLGTIRSDSGGLDSRNHRFTGAYNIYYSASHFIRPVSIELNQSSPQNIDFQSTIGAQVGYDIFKDPYREWEVSIGPSWVYTKFDTVIDGYDHEESSFGISINSYFETELRKDIDLSHTYSLTTNNKASGGMIHHNLVSLSIDVTEVVEMEVDFVWDRTESPVAKKTGERPEKDDFRLSFGVGFDF